MRRKARLLPRRGAYNATLASLCVLVLAVACGGQGETQEEAAEDDAVDESADTADTPGEPTELIWADGNLGTMRWNIIEAGSRNRVSSAAWGETLLAWNMEAREFEGRLAESWSVSDDGLTWTFKLRPDIPFHDDWGTVTTEDVRYTWEQYIHPDSGQGVRTEMRAAMDDDMANFEIVDDLEFKLHASEPFPTLELALSDAWPGPLIFSSRYAEEMGEEAVAEHPIGTGPWKFVSSTPGVEVVAEAVPDHWRQPPGFDRLVLKEIGDSAAMLSQLRSGAIDIASMEHGLVGEALAAGMRVLQVEDVYNISGVFGGLWDGFPEYDGDAPWIQDDNPEQGLAIRQAMSLAVDQDAIIDVILGGFGTKSYTGHLENIPELYEGAEIPVFDLELAMEKLAEGGYPDGFAVEVPIVETTVPTVAIGEAVAGMWEELGLDVERVPYEQAVFEEQRLAPRQTDGMVWVYHGPLRTSVEPAARLELISSGRTEAKWVHPTIDDIHARIMTETDRDERMAIAREAFEFMYEGQWTIPIVWAPILFVAGPSVGEWHNTENNLPHAFEGVMPAG